MAGPGSLTLSLMASHANAAAAPPDAADWLAGAVQAALAEFARKLRWLGLEVSTTELADATRAVSGVDLLDRARLGAGFR